MGADHSLGLLVLSVFLGGVDQNWLECQSEGPGLCFEVHEFESLQISAATRWHHCTCGLTLCVQSQLGLKPTHDNYKPPQT